MMDRKFEPARLPACPTPHPGESIMGYGLRLAELNGYRSLRRVFSLVGHRTMPRDLKWVDFTSLAELFAHPEAILRDMSYPIIGKGRQKLLGRELQSFAIESNRPRLCLECLATNFEFKALWDLTLLICCPVHGRYLLADCPQCQLPLDWGRPKWNRCRCGYDFSSYSAPEAPAELVIFSRYVEKALSEDASAAEFNELTGLDGVMSADSLMIFVSFLGYWSVNESHAPLGKMFQGTSMEERGRYIQAALDILKGWPGEFYRFLDRVKGKDPYPDTTVLMYKEFGRLFYNLMYVYRSPDLDFVREALKFYDTRRREELACEGLSGAEVETIGFHGPAKDVACSATALKKMAKVGGVSFRKLKPVGSLRKVVVTSDSKADLAKRQAERIRYIDVVRLLGIRPPMVRKLIDEGLLTKDQATILDGRGDESYFQDEVEALLAELSKLAKPISAAGVEGKLFPIVKAFQIYSRGEFSVLDVLESVRKGLVPAYKEVGLFDLSRLRVCHRQLSKVVAEVVIGDDREYVDLVTALGEFDLTKSELKTILKHDAVEHFFRPFGGRNYTLINRSSLNDFLTEHVRLSSLEAVMGKSGRYVKQYLAEKGMKPVWSKLHGDTGSWFRRSELKELGLGF